jgi:SNF2 family DNA or RNA helicase
VAKELPPKTELVHLIELHTAQKDLYETVRATMNKRVREAIAARGMDQFQIVFLDALLKLRQICCDPRLLPDEFANTIHESAKLDFLTDLFAVLIEEGRRILIFSQFTTMLALIEAHLVKRKSPTSNSPEPPRTAANSSRISKPEKSRSSSSRSRPAAPAST